MTTIIGTRATAGAVTSSNLRAGLCRPAVTLARYAERIGYRDCAFWGVRHENDDDYECRRVWTKSQRDQIEWALRQAQDTIEQELRYFLAPCWVEAERHAYGDPIVLNWGHVVGAGVQADTVVGDSVAVDYATDPATVTVAPGTHAAANLRIFHEDTGTEIVPLSYAGDGSGNLVFQIPWCRLVDPAYADNPAEGLDYGSAATWRAARVDVRAIENSIATEAELIWRHECSDSCALRGCADYRQTACVYVRDGKLGVVDVTRADYASGVWTATALCSSYCRGLPQWVEVSYLAGLTTLTRQAEDAIIRLAHTLLPQEPCGCGPSQYMWQHDTKVPEVLSRERVNCPWGQSEGAWWAWRQAQTMKLIRGSVL